MPSLSLLVHNAVTPEIIEEEYDGPGNDSEDSALGLSSLGIGTDSVNQPHSAAEGIRANKGLLGTSHIVHHLHRSPGLLDNSRARSSAPGSG